ncbi:MAG: hypothetical protein QOH05_194 [Acetobacteraceae bacterium]|jgi:hypothetical protein|nr:hypothetical protein [Acetobacteraceae bacterium]
MATNTIDRWPSVARGIAAVLGLSVLALGTLAPMPARADFFDGMRQTFTSDIPHFFQDDVPCAFGGKPTSHTRTSCKSGQAKGGSTNARENAAPPPPPLPDRPAQPDTGR